MKLSEFKKRLENVKTFSIQLPNGKTIPAHFHITEMGLQTKNFIDCGNTIRQESVITFQVWLAADLYHRLAPSKIMKIIEAAKKLTGDQDLELEVEYQVAETIGKFGLDFKDGKFILTPKETTCLANDHCGLPTDKIKDVINACCGAESNCC
jgi:hypothetical protein